MKYAIMSIAAAIISFIITAALGKFVIPWLHKLKFGQTIKEIGPTWHAKKQGTPTMGGIMFIAGITVSIAVCIPVYNALVSYYNAQGVINTVRLWGGLIMALLYGVTGFIDDYIGIVHKENKGLGVKSKLLIQILIAAAYLFAIYITEGGAGSTTIPFLGTVDLGIWFYLVALVMIVGFVNAVNLTDGIDGLCSSVTFFAIIVFMLIAGIRAMFDIGIVAAAVAGGCLGFLIWNFNPAKVFMGDTGSLFLGGIFCAVAFATDMPILIPLVGIVFLCEAGSVLMQTIYFKLTHGKRIFKMSPIHHHFEMSGWSEVKIVAVFSIVGLLAGAIAVLLTILGQ